MSDLFVALPPVTAKGCVLFAKNSDRPPSEVQEVIYCPPADHEPGSKVKVSMADDINRVSLVLIGFRICFQLSLILSTGANRHEDLGWKRDISVMGR